MTDAPSRPKRARPKRPGAFPVVSGSIAAFFALFGFLAYQVRAGNDPALGAAQPAPKRVVVKRIERRVIVTRVLPPRTQPTVTGGTIASAPAIAAAPAPAPAPALASAPAPAPAPAPVTTQQS